MQLDDVKIGFAGTGRMATALAKGFSAGSVTASQIYGVDPFDASRAAFSDAVGSEATVSNDPKTVATTDIVFLAVKPQMMESVLQEFRPVLTGGKLIVSVAAGIRIETLEGWLPDDCRLIRVMPNTPCLIGQGACGISAGSNATASDVELICTLLSTVGLVEQVPERLLDAVTGLSGSGPAYVFQIIEALSDGGVKVGLPRDVATRLAAQTLLGAAELVLQTGEHPGALKDAVTSPGGTTIAAIHEMETGGVRAALMSAVEASTRRSIELG